jgi:hypothetical protein
MSGSYLCVPRNEIGLVISKTELCLPISTFMYLWAVYIFPGLVCAFCCNQIGRPIPGIYTVNCSQIHECRNWERGCVVLFLEIHESDFQHSAVCKVLRLFPGVDCSEEAVAGLAQLNELLEAEMNFITSGTHCKTRECPRIREKRRIERFFHDVLRCVSQQ